jgi:membrane protease YdiL (CAAX protease family)
MYQYMLVGAPIFISIIFVTRLGQFKPADMGLTFKNLPVQLLIAPLGIVLGYVEYLVLQPKPLVSEFNLNSILVPAVILLVFTGLLEELVFRGLMQKAFITELGTWGGLFFVASVFAVLHFGYLSVLDVLFVFCVAVIFGIIVLYSGSVVGVTLAHGLTNLTLFLIFPFLLGEQTSLTLPQLGETSPHQRYYVYTPSPIGADGFTENLLANKPDRSDDWLEITFVENDTRNWLTEAFDSSDQMLLRPVEDLFTPSKQGKISSKFIANKFRRLRLESIGERI